VIVAHRIIPLRHKPRDTGVDSSVRDQVETVLILPHQKGMSLRRLPLATLFLALACIAVFFTLKRADDALVAQAQQTYEASSLASIELPRYRDWLVQKKTAQAQSTLELLQRNPQAVFHAIESEPAFREALRSLQIVKPTDIEFERWKSARQSVDDLLDRRTGPLLTSQPGAPFWTLVTHAFVHPDLIRLIGNVLVLLLIGPFVEAAIGRWRYLLAYVACAIAAGAAHGAFLGSPLVGAAGPLAGLMAMSIVLLGRRRVRISVWLLMPIVSAKIPALTLTAAWVLNEIVQRTIGSLAPLSFWPEVAGALTGAVLAWLLRASGSRFVDAAVATRFGGDFKEDRYTLLTREAEHAEQRGDAAKAARMLREMLRMQPQSVDNLSRYFDATVRAGGNEVPRALRVALRFRSADGKAQLRPIYLRMARDDLLRLLPVPDQLRLVRRLASTREDRAAVLLIDQILANGKVREEFAPLITECLTFLYQAYSRYGLKPQAAAMQERMMSYFFRGAPTDGSGGSSRFPSTLQAPSGRPTAVGRGPDTAFIDMSQ
jgi:membrane associated rhomboid family serine protease